MSVCGFRPPEPLAADAPQNEFSALRAMRHVRQIARHPHPAGSEENAQVRLYLESVLEDMGLAPELHHTQSGGFELVNLLARIEGTDSTGVIMIAAHYDSVAAGPGAGDDGAAVAALLEVCRILLAEERLANDVVLLISDGEEQGLLGAERFVAEHPWAKEVRLVCNFEGRGCRGPSTMFETSPGNGRLIEEFARVVPRPLSSSLSYRIYQLLPNDTDFSEFKAAGMAGYNFAFLDGTAAYHTPLDTPENLSLHSLQHHGDQALALVRHWGNLSLGDLRADDRVWFTLPGGLLVHYSFALARVTSLAAAALALGLLVVGLKRKWFTPKSLGTGMASVGIGLGVAVAGGLVAWLGFKALEAIGLAPSLAQGESRRTSLVVFALWNLAVFLLWEVRWWWKDCTGTAAAGVATWAVLALAGGLFLPEVSYLATWPLAAAVVALWAERLAAERHVAEFTRIQPEASVAEFARIQPARAASAVILLAAAVPILLFSLSHQYFFFMAGARRPWASVLAAMGLAALTISLLQPQLELVFRATKRWGHLAWAAAAGIAVVAAWAGV